MRLKNSIVINTIPTNKQKIINKYINYLGLELEQSEKALQIFDFAITSYYQDLIDKLIRNGETEIAKRILLSIIPNNIETENKSEIEDGIGEDETAEGNPIISKLFPNRVLISINNRCPVYCRYCFRRRRLGKDNPKIQFKQIDEALTYVKNEIIKAKKNNDIYINEIILSGGEPLAINKNVLESLIKKINNINDIKTCRIDTKLLAVKPTIFTEDLLEILSKFKTLYLINHFIHYAEITEIVQEKVLLLLKYGIISGAHIPILKNINDDYYTIKKLVEKLYQNKIRPYYLIQFIPTKWTEHFRVPLMQSIEIRERLARECSGFSIPSLIVYLPNGKGKAIVNSKRDVKKIKDGYLLYNTFGEEVLYEEKI